MNKKRRNKVSISAPDPSGKKHSRASYPIKKALHSVRRSSKTTDFAEDGSQSASGQISYHARIRRKLTSSVIILAVISAAVIMLVTMFVPVMSIYGNSMVPALNDGSIVVSVRASGAHTGDIVAFDFNNKILVKRVIAVPGESVDIDEAGNVFVNGELLDEPYVQEPAKGNCDIELPCKVPDGKLFVLGDHRSNSQDSRLQTLGCIDKERIVGKVLFKIWSPRKTGGVD